MLEDNQAYEPEPISTTIEKKEQLENKKNKETGGRGSTVVEAVDGAEKLLFAMVDNNF